MPLLPSYVPSLSPLCANQTLTTLSFEQEKRRSPSRLNLIWFRDRSWPERRIGLCKDAVRTRIQSSDSPTPPRCTHHLEELEMMVEFFLALATEK